MKNKTIFWGKIIIFIEYVSIISVIVLISSLEKIGAAIVFLPWLLSITIISSLIGILLSLKMKLENLDEKIDNSGPLGPKPQIFYSSRKQLLSYSIFFLILSTIGFVLIINQFYFSPF